MKSCTLAITGFIRNGFSETGLVIITTILGILGVIVLPIIQSISMY